MVTTSREARLLALVNQGTGLPSAAEAVGLTLKKATKILSQEKHQKVLATLDRERAAPARIDRSMLTMMLLEAHRKAGTATEEISAIKELGKMHGLYEPEVIKQVSLNADVTNRVANMSDAELLGLLGKDEGYDV
jgi:hypothetical protein